MMLHRLRLSSIFLFPGYEQAAGKTLKVSINGGRKNDSCT